MGLWLTGTLGEPPQNLFFPSQAWGGWAQGMTSAWRNEESKGLLPPGALSTPPGACSLAGDPQAADSRGHPNNSLRRLHPHPVHGTPSAPPFCSQLQSQIHYWLWLLADISILLWMMCDPDLWLTSDSGHRLTPRLRQFQFWFLVEFWTWFRPEPSPRHGRWLEGSWDEVPLPAPLASPFWSLGSGQARSICGAVWFPEGEDCMSGPPLLGVATRRRDLALGGVDAGFLL